MLTSRLKCFNPRIYRMKETYSRPPDARNFELVLEATIKNGGASADDFSDLATPLTRSSSDSEDDRPLRPPPSRSNSSRNLRPRRERSGRKQKFSEWLESESGDRETYYHFDPDLDALGVLFVTNDEKNVYLKDVLIVDSESYEVIQEVEVEHKVR